MHPSFGSGAWIEHVIVILTGLSVLASAALKLMPTPDEVKDAEGKVSGWYVLLYNALRWASINSPFQSRNGDQPKTPPAP